MGYLLVWFIHVLWSFAVDTVCTISILWCTYAEMVYLYDLVGPTEPSSWWAVPNEWVLRNPESLTCLYQRPATYYELFLKRCNTPPQSSSVLHYDSPTGSGHAFHPVSFPNSDACKNIRSANPVAQGVKLFVLHCWLREESCLVIDPTEIRQTSMSQRTGAIVVFLIVKSITCKM